MDLAPLRHADPPFRWAVLREGRLIWGDSLDHLEYRAFAYRDFVDSADLRALERIVLRAIDVKKHLIAALATGRHVDHVEEFLERQE